MSLGTPQSSLVGLTGDSAAAAVAVFMLCPSDAAASADMRRAVDAFAAKSSLAAPLPLLESDDFKEEADASVKNPPAVGGAEAFAVAHSALARYLTPSLWPLLPSPHAFAVHGATIDADTTHHETNRDALANNAGGRGRGSSGAIAKRGRAIVFDAVISAVPTRAQLAAPLAAVGRLLLSGGGGPYGAAWAHCGGVGGVGGAAQYTVADAMADGVRAVLSLSADSAAAESLLLSAGLKGWGRDRGGHGGSSFPFQHVHEHAQHEHYECSFTLMADALDFKATERLAAGRGVPVGEVLCNGRCREEGKEKEEVKKGEASRANDAAAASIEVAALDYFIDLVTVLRRKRSTEEKQQNNSGAVSSADGRDGSAAPSAAIVMVPTIAGIEALAAISRLQQQQRNNVSISRGAARQELSDGEGCTPSAHRRRGHRSEERSDAGGSNKTSHRNGEGFLLPLSGAFALFPRRRRQPSVSSAAKAQSAHAYVPCLLRLTSVVQQDAIVAFAEGTADGRALLGATDDDEVAGGKDTYSGDSEAHAVLLRCLEAAGISIVYAEDLVLEEVEGGDAEGRAEEGTAHGEAGKGGLVAATHFSPTFARYLGYLYGEISGVPAGGGPPCRSEANVLAEGRAAACANLRPPPPLPPSSSGEGPSPSASDSSPLDIPSPPPPCSSLPPTLPNSPAGLAPAEGGTGDGDDDAPPLFTLLPPMLSPPPPPTPPPAPAPRQTEGGRSANSCYKILADRRAAFVTFAAEALLGGGGSDRTPDTSLFPYIHQRCYARVGLMGNPSDNFNGRCLSLTIANYWADVHLLPRSLTALGTSSCTRRGGSGAPSAPSTSSASAFSFTLSSSAVHIVPSPIADPSAFSGGLADLAATAHRDGYSGGARLIHAACAALYSYVRRCAESAEDNVSDDIIVGSARCASGRGVPYGPRRGLSAPEPQRRAAAVVLRRMGGGGDWGFTLAYHTNIPRQVGLAGSSCIVVAVLKALCRHYKIQLTAGGDAAEPSASDVDAATTVSGEERPSGGSVVPPPPFAISESVLASIALSAESEGLDIAAGLQDRAAQSIEGLVAMDFAAPHLKATGCGRYTAFGAIGARTSSSSSSYSPSHLPLPLPPLPPLYLAVARDPSDSGRMHQNIKQRYENGDAIVAAAAREWAGLTDSTMAALRLSWGGGRMLSSSCTAAQTAPDWAAFCDCVDANLALRRRLYTDPCLGSKNLEMVSICQRHGAAAKFPGSGGSILVVPRGPWAVARGAAKAEESPFAVTDVAALRRDLEARGYYLVRLRPHYPSV